MSNIKKLMMSAAGGGGLDVDEVFSTYLYTGNGSSQTITNGIDLAGEGGLVWLKGRNLASNNTFVDTERGATQTIASNTSAQASVAQTVTAFNSDGFSIGTDGNASANTFDFTSWTFRKAPKFFDVVTYTGNGVAGLTVSHNLGVVPGCIIVKSTSGIASNWAVYHRSNTASPETDVLTLNTTNATQDNNNYWHDTAPTATQFTVGGGETNGNGSTYVAYLFAHNDGDGEFGPDGDQDIIKCGSYTGNGLNAGQEIDLGFEPQFVLYKCTNNQVDWRMVDNMRGVPTGSNHQYLRPNQTSPEYDDDDIEFYANGFRPKTAGLQINSGGASYIYMAIRRGSLFPPESATDVFAAAYQNAVNTSPGWTSGFPVDMSLDKNIGGGSTDEWSVSSRLTGSKYFYQIASSGEGGSSDYAYDFMDGWREVAYNGPSDFSWMWKRAPGFFDVVAYTSDGTYPAQPHNLGVVPELVIMKRRSGSVGMGWYVTGFQSGKYLQLDSAAAAGNVGTVYTTHTATHFKPFNESDCIAYLFATLPGISKVGSYTGNGSSQTINCGFTSGARFILVKRTDSTGDWYVWDTTRGIVAGNDPYLELNTLDAEVTSTDWVDPDNSGFIVNGTTINASSASYIFYAIA